MRQYRKKMKSEWAYRTWVGRNLEIWIKGHWSHETVTEPFVVAHLSSQLYEIIQMLQTRMSDLDPGPILDAGASDGLFLSELGATTGIGMNLLSQCVDKIKANGFIGIQGSIEKIPFDSKSMDYVLCCETLEHVQNPIQAINELVRICRKKIFVTIPYLPKTRISARATSGPIPEGHLFEFNPEDFRKIIDHTNVRITYSDFIHVFPEPWNPLSRLFLRRFMYPYFFPKLQYYELEPI